MMQLARRASLVVVLLLASMGTASAGCARVLWFQEDWSSASALKPTALDVPDIDVGRVEHPSPITPLGAKGVGEGGAIPGPAAIANAVEDALAPYGVTVRALPLTPEAVWRWLAAGGGA